MHPDADVELEVRRLGGVNGVINLLRNRAAEESDGAYAGRIELGAALLGCKLGLDGAHTKRGATPTAFVASKANGRDHEQYLADNSSIDPPISSWASRAFTAVLDVLLEAGGPSSKARDTLFRLVAALGSHAAKAGAMPQLFGLLSGAVVGTKVQCCRHVSRALALCLHESAVCAESSARDEQRVTILLALAFPGRVQPPGVRKQHLPGPGRGSDRKGAASAPASGPAKHGEEVLSIRDQEMRENSLSCLYSIVKADATATRIILATGGLRLLFALAMGEEPVPDDERRPTTPQGQSSGRRRPRTSLSGGPASSGWRDKPALSSSPATAAVGDTRRRPTTTRPSTSGIRSSLGTGGSSTHGAAERAPIADLAIWEKSMARGSDGGSSASGGARASGKVGAAAAAAAAAAAPQQGTFSVPPMPERGVEKQAGAGKRKQGAETRPGSTAETLKPRTPSVDAPHGGGGGGGGGGAAKSKERMAGLATAILIACFRRQRHVTTTAKGLRERRGRTATARGRLPGSDGEGCDDDGHTTPSERKPAAAAAAGAAAEPPAQPASSSPSRSGAMTEPPPPPPVAPRRRSRRPRRYAHQSENAAAAASGARKSQKSGKGTRRVRGKKLSFSWRGGGRRAAAEAAAVSTTASSDAPSSPNRAEAPEAGESPADLRGDGRSSAEVGGYILGRDAGGEGRRGGQESSTAVDRLLRDRQVGEAAAEAAGFPELESLGAVSRVPELLSATGPLLQELGVLILERGIEELEEDEEEEQGDMGLGGGEEEEEADGIVPADRGDSLRGDGVVRQTARRRASTSAATKRRSGRRQLFRNVVAGSGTTLRSLCWLLLHCRRHVSEGAAAVLLTLATTDAGHRKGRSEAGIAAWVVLGLVEQGCVPILRMAAGRPGVLSSPTTRGKGGVGDPAAAVAAAAAAGMAREGCRGDVPRQTARAVLEAVVQEACGRHVDRLVHSLAVSGNRELRGNVTLALGILSAGTGGDQGRKAWRSFVSGGALTAVLGMLRSPTGRAAAVTFLRVISALLEGPPAPPDFFRRDDVGAADGADEGRQEAGGGLAGNIGSGGDTVVLVRDPLAYSGEAQGSRGGQAEGEGIKMACPPRQVICRASPILKRVVLGTPAGQLPLLHGRYRAWEEVMAHMAAPHTFAATSNSYSTGFLVEIFALAATFQIKAQADGYAHELWRRLFGSPPPVQPCALKADDVAPITRGALDTSTAGSPLPSTNGVDSGGGDKNVGPTTRGNPVPVSELSEVEVRPVGSNGRSGLSSGDSKSSRSGGSGSGSSSSSSSNSHRNRHEESMVFAVLEASLRSGHGWLCVEAFREASGMVGSGDREGLPPPPRKLTAVLAVLQRFTSLLWVAGGNQMGGSTGEIRNG